MYLLDTNHCTFILEGTPTVVERLRSLGEVAIATSVVVAGELGFMAQNSGPKEKSRRKTTRLSGIGISENDLWIASAALRHSLTIVSADSDFERMRLVRELPLESWL